MASLSRRQDSLKQQTIVDDIGLKIIEEAFVNQLPIDDKIITKLEEMKVQGDSAEAN